MSLETVPLEQITESHLLKLKADAEPEGLRLEYKDRVESSDEKKKEFLRDVSSFANTSGGDFLIGVAEEDGIPTDICGVDVPNADAEVSRIEQIIRSGLEPALSAFRTRQVQLGNGHYVFVIRIRQSWAAPHRVKFQSTPQFYARRSNGKYALEAHELRAAFVLSETLAERIRNFRIDRVARIIANDGAVSLSPGTRHILHIVPFAAFRSGTVCEFRGLEGDFRDVGPLYWPRSGTRYNLDGLLATSEPASKPPGYCQFYRNGIIEAVDACFTDERAIPYPGFDNTLVDGIKRLLKLQQQMGVQPPLFAMLTLTGVRGYKIALPLQFWAARRTQPEIDRDDLLIPEIMIDSFDCDVLCAAMPMINAVWNAAGYPYSIYQEARGQLKA